MTNQYPVRVLGLVFLTLLAGCSEKKAESPTSRPEKQQVIINAVKDPKADAKSAKQVATLRSTLVKGDAVQFPGQTFVTGIAPGSKTRPWKPRRFFGPWFMGSDLTQIQVSLEGPVTSPSPTWYYAGFFASVQADEPGDTRIYSQYIANIATRIETPPRLMPVPGLAPSGSNLPRINKMRFWLSEIFARSRYGGSIELRFRSSQDFEYQVSSATTRWDIRELTMSIFVTPIAAQMNPAGPAQHTAFHSLQVEFEPSGVTAYDAASGNVKADNEFAALTTVLQTLANEMEIATGAKPFSHSTFKRDASQFAHAWIHTQQQDLFDANQSPPERVDAIELSDQYMMLHTRAPEVHFRWSMRLLHTSSGPEVPRLFEVGALHQFVGQPAVAGPGYAWVLLPFQQTRQMHLGTFRLDECGSLNAMVAVIRVHDGESLSDPLLQHQFITTELVPGSFQGATTVNASLTVDCTTLNNFVQTLAPPIPGAQAPDRVLYMIREQEIELLTMNLDHRGRYHIFALLEIIYR